MLWTDQALLYPLKRVKSTRKPLIVAAIALSLIVISCGDNPTDNNDEYIKGIWKAIGYIMGGIAIIIAINSSNRLSNRLSGRMKEISSLIISVTSASAGVTQYNVVTMEKAVLEEVVSKTEKTIVDSMKAGEGRLMASQEELKRLLTQLDSSAVYRDSLSAKIDSVDKHITRHFDFMYPRVKEIQENVKKD